MPVPRVLLCATTTGYQIRNFDEAATRLGVELRLASDRCQMLDDPWRDHAIAVKFHDLDESTRVVAEAFGAAPPDGVIAVGDRPATLAAAVASRFGIPWHSIAAVEASRVKVRSREQMRAAGLVVPWFHLLPPGESDAAPFVDRYPCVIKPVMLSGSRGVMRADNDAELRERVARLRRLLAQPDVAALRDADGDRILIEGFIPGREYALEGLLDGGDLHVLTVFDKPDPLDGPFFEETLYVTPSRASQGTQERIVDAITSACRALGLRHGPIHAECRVGPGGVCVLEVAPRPIGGLCARALRFVDGEAPAIPLEELLLRHAAGLEWRQFRREASASGVLMIPIPHAGIFKGVEGQAEALAVPGVSAVEITAKLDQLLVPLPEGATYLGFIFAKGETASIVETAMREAHRVLRPVIARAVPIA